MPDMFKRIALIGIGLIGASIAHVVRREGLAQSIAISTRTAETLKRAEELSLGDLYSLDPLEAVEGADCVFICAPVGAYEKIAETIGPALTPGTIVTDVGSVKQSAIKQIRPHLPAGVQLVPGHPIAGTEYSGPDAGFASLFTDRWCILTPEPDTDPQAVQAIKAFWEKCGSQVEIMDPQHHDLVLAITSHIPHLIAYNIVGTADDLEADTRSEVIKFSASGFRDFTRIAASDPVMWRDVFIHNKEAVLEALGRFSEDLSSLQRAIRRGDGEQLYQLFSRTREIRRSIVEIGQDVNLPNFGRDIPDQPDS